jgi:hypothetical protein
MLLVKFERNETNSETGQVSEVNIKTDLQGMECKVSTGRISARTGSSGGLFMDTKMNLISFSRRTFVDRKVTYNI